MSECDPDNDMYIVSVREILTKILSQDHFWWDHNEYERRKSSLLRHGNLITLIHEHFRKLEPEYCSTLLTRSRRSSACSSVSHGDPQPAWQWQSRIMIQKEVRESRMSLRKDFQKLRKRHISADSALASPRSDIIRSASLIHSSYESLHSRGSDVGYKNSLSRKELEMYRGASLCCNFPVLAVKSDQGRNSYLDGAYPIPFRHYSLATSRKLLEYLGHIFHLNTTKHQQYQISIGRGEQSKEKEEMLKDSLRSQLSLVETDSSPYYSKESFQSYFDYKCWQDSERDEISRLLGGNISRHHGRYRQRERPSTRDRGADYKSLLKKVMTYDLQNVRCTNDSTSSISADSYSAASDTDSSELYGEYDQIICKTGQRLLKEFAARYRIALTTQVCLYLEVAETCIAEGLLNFKMPTAMRNLQKMITKLQVLFQERMPLLTSEVNMVIHVCGCLLNRIKQLIITLLTEWKPTTEELSCGLKLAQSCYEILNLLKCKENSEWPHCLFKWFEAATIDDYHSYKKPNFIATPTSVLSSVSHAVEVVRSMQNADADSIGTNYQSVFSEYIPNFPQAVCRGLYEAVMTDVKLLRNKFPWQRTKPLERNRYDGTEMKKNQEVLNLANIAIAYKLAEFDKLLHSDGFTVSVYYQPEESWRLYFHEFAMHWLDVLSCHLRRLVLRAIRLDDYKRPKKRSDIGRSVECANSSQKISPPILEEDASISEHMPGEDLSTMHFMSEGAENQVNMEDDIYEMHSGRSHIREEKHQGTESVFRYGEGHLVEEIKEEESDSDTIEDNESAATMSSENPCKLVSYRKISDSPDNSSITGSYYSCEPDDSVTENSNNWATSDSANYSSLSETNLSSDRKFSSALTSSDQDVVSNCSSSRTSSCDSILPALIKVHPLHLTKSSSLADGTRGALDPEVEASVRTSETLDEKSSVSTVKEESLLEDDIVCNVSSSVVDVISMISRFLQFACRIVNTVYCLPMTKKCYSGSDSDDLSAETLNSYLLKQLKENFMHKVVQSVCEVIRQYSNNIVNIDQNIIPREIVRELIGRRKLAEIFNGRYNKSVVTGSMYFYQPFISEVRPDDSLFHKMINRLNSLLVLEHGLPDLWLHIEQAMSSTKSLLSSSNAPSSLFPFATSPEQNHLFMFPVDTSPDILSSDDTPCTSSSARTAIYRSLGKSNTPKQDDLANDKNNNDNAVIGIGKAFDQEEPSLSTNGDDVMDHKDIKHTSHEVVEKNASTSSLHSSTEPAREQPNSGGERQEFPEPMWNFLQDYLESHISVMVQGMTGFLAYKSAHWFSIMLNLTLKDTSVVIDERTNANYTPGSELISRLNILLDTLSSLLHKEGINDVHEKLWMKILQHFRDASSTLQEVDAKLHASHSLSVFTIVLKIWKHHPSRPNNGDHDWLVKPIQPTLNMLELYSHFTEILLGMYQRCEEEIVLNFDLMSASASRKQITNCREVILQAMQILQDRKSFSGEMLHSTLRTIICDQNPSIADRGYEDADCLCQHMLEQDMLLFVFKQTPKKNNDQIPDVIPVSSLDYFAREGRSFSVSTGDSQQSFPSTEDQSFVTQSYSSDYHSTFYNEANFFYRFSPTLLPMSVSLDDLIKLLRVRSKTDKSAKRFLQQHGHLPRSPLSMCFGGCWS